MPNDAPYSLAHAARKGPKIIFGRGGMHRVEPENKSKVVIETPGVKDETEKTREMTPEEVRKEAIKNRGGLYSDRIKIEPKFGAEPREKPLPSDTEIQKALVSRVTKI